MNDYGGAARDVSEEFAVNSAELVAGVEDDENKVSVGEGLHGFTNANVFGFIESFADSGGIDEAHGDSAERYGFGYEVAGGSGKRGDDGALAFDELIEEAGFAYVGATDDGEGQSLVHYFAEGKAGGESTQRRFHVFECGEDLIGWHDGDIVFGEVDSGFEPCDEGDQFFFNREYDS